MERTLLADFFLFSYCCKLLNPQLTSPPPDHHYCDFAKLDLDQCFPFCGLDSWAEYKIASKPSFTCSVCLKSTSSTFGRNLVEKSTAILTRDLLSIKLHFSLPWSDRKSAKIFLAMEYLSAEL